MRSGIMVPMENVASTVADAAYPKTSTHDMLTSFMPSAFAFFGVFGGLLFAGPRWSGTQLILRIWWDGCALPQRLSRFPAAGNALSPTSLVDRGTPPPA